MRTLLRLVLVAVIAFVASSCIQEPNRRIVGPTDSIAPEEPRSVYTTTGDGKVTVHWSVSRATDVEGYAIFISAEDHDYWFLAQVPASRRHWVVDGSRIPGSVPLEFVNGNTYWFGVTAFDRAGNESELSAGSTTFDTPRPAGEGLKLFDLHGPRAYESGYDFSRSPFGYAMNGTDLFADMYYANEFGVPTMRTAHPGVVELQDMGRRDFNDPLVGWFVEDGWGGQTRLPLSPGHVYLVRIWEETRPGNTQEPFHVGKFQVTRIDAAGVTLRWAYQIAPNNRQLKAPQGSVGQSPSSGHAGREVHR